MQIYEAGSKELARAINFLDAGINKSILDDKKSDVMKITFKNCKNSTCFINFPKDIFVTTLNIPFEAVHEMFALIAYA